MRRPAGKGAATVRTGTRYVVAYTAPSGHYAFASYFFAPGPLTSASLTAIGGLNVDNGVYGDKDSFPSHSYHQTNYWVDVVFEPAAKGP